MRAIDIDDVIVWVALGVVLGGRLGYVLFYNPAYFAANPAEIFVVWRGGMSFHGGFLGAIIALLLFARSRGIPMLSMLDVAAVVTPIGLFLGRIANFINGELWGRVTDVPWALVFPNGGPSRAMRASSTKARSKASCCSRSCSSCGARGALKYPGMIGGMFVVGYGVARIVCEFFREPDAQTRLPHAAG